MATNLGVKLTLDHDQYLAALTKAQNATSKAVSSIKSSSMGLGALAGFVSLGAIINKISEETKEAQVNQAQLNAVIKSTGGAAGVSADTVNELADKYEKLTTVDNDLIVGMENTLLTFTNIKDNVFPETTLATMDLAHAMGKDLGSAAVMVGKALNNPIQGITALQKVGVSFSAQQKEQIKNFMRVGDVAKAQKIILAELNREFGGSAASQAKTFQGAINRIENTIGRLAEKIGNAATPGLMEFAAQAEKAAGSLDKVAEYIGKVIGYAATLIPYLKDMYKYLGYITGINIIYDMKDAVVGGAEWLGKKFGITFFDEASKEIKKKAPKLKPSGYTIGTEPGGGGGKSSQSKLPSLVDGSGLVPPFVAAGLNNSIAESLRKQADATKDLEEKTRLLEAAEKAELKVKSQIFDGVTSVINYISNMVGAVDQLYAAQAQSQMDNLDKMKSNLDMYIDYSMQREMELAGVKEETALQSAQKQEIALRRQIARTTNLSRRKALQEQLIESQKEKKRLQIQEEAEKRREQIELLYELFKRQMTIREFNRQKQYQYGMAAMNMAAGIIGAFAQGIAQLGPIAGAIVGAVEAAAVAALGGVQMAMISAQSPPAFSQGSWDVGTTGPAILHGGEIVVPPTMADSIRAGNAVLGGGAGSGQVVNINVHGSVIDKKGFLKAMKEAANFGKFKLGPSGAY
jgi:hypothetical protein